ncbi:hypothetical protein [Kocuria sp. LHG3120]|uniref:hypothetical protein n=1 Tax=Kocuria sp. LHG3120 TaxID=2804590 RepID=UPI003CEB8184
MNETASSTRSIGTLVVVVGIIVVAGMVWATWLTWAPRPNEGPFDENAWLDMVASIAAAMLGGLFAGLVLRNQLKTQSDLHEDALDKQRDEARRAREIDAMVELIRFLRNSDFVKVGFIAQENVNKFNDLTMRWQMNSGLISSESDRFLKLLLDHFHLLAWARLHRKTQVAERSEEEEAFANRSVGETQWVDVHAVSQIRSENDDLITQLMYVPNMTMVEKVQYIDELDSRLQGSSQSLKIEKGHLPPQARGQFVL